MFGDTNSREITITVDIPALPGSEAATEHVPSPLRQAHDGVPLNKIICNDGRVLMQSPSGSSVCVFEASTSTLVDRGFVLAVPREP